MRKYLFLFSIHSFLSISQPQNYVPGTHVCWNFNGRDHGYFKSASANGEKHILISFTGNGETNCGGLNAQAPQKWLNDSGINWDGNTTRPDGTVVNWEIFTFFNNVPTSNLVGDDLAFFFNQIGYTNTVIDRKMHVQGLSGGVGRLWEYINNFLNYSTNSPFRFIFGTTISMSGVSAGFTNFTQQTTENRKHWIWHGQNDSNPNTPVATSQEIYNKILFGEKILTIQPGTGHGADTWDVALALPTPTSTPQDNRWLWMVDNTTLSNNVFETLNFEVSPIPAKENLNISFNSLTATKVRLFDHLGKVIIYQEYNSDKISLDLFNIKGLCFLEIETLDGTKYSKKIIVE